MKKIFPAVLSAAFGATVFFFSPADIFLSNQADFIINTARMIIPLGITAAAVSLAVFVILLVLDNINHKIYAAVSSLLLGAVGAAYFQMTFFNGRMTALDGGKINYSSIDLYNTVDFIIFFVILMLPLILFTAREQSADNKLLKKLDSTKAAYLCAAVVFMQSAGTVSLAVVNGVHNNSPDVELPLISYRPAMELSGEKNIVVFLTDKLDSFWMDEMTERYPEINDKLDGFTFYRDNLSEQCLTFPSVTQLLTRKEYAEEGEYPYIDSAWKSDNLPKRLHDSGWRVYLMPDSSTTYSNMSQIEPFMDNTLDYSYSINYLGNDGVCATMIRLSLYKCLPYFYKPFFMSNYSDVANNFLTFDDYENEKSVLPYRIGISSDIKYYSFISENEFSTDSDVPTFSFIHLNSAHDASGELSALNSGFDGKCDEVSTARGSFECIFRYMSELERLGIYDDTVIIIIADHGDVPDYIDGKEISSPDVAALLVKPANSRGQLVFDDSSQLSNRNFAASVLEYAGLDHSVYGSSYNDIIQSGGRQERIFNGTNYYNFGSEYVGQFSKFTYRIVYKVDGNSRDFDNWELVS